MAISRELKEYLNGKREAEIKTLKAKREEQFNNNITNYLNTNVEILEIQSNMELVRNIISDLINNYKIHASYDIKNFVRNGFNLNKLVPTDITNANLKNIDDEIILVENKYDSLIIRLSMEKDFERINSILLENGVGL